MDQRAGDQCQLEGRVRIVVGVVLNEGAVDLFGAFLLADQIKHFGTPQIARESLVLRVGIVRIRRGALKLGDRFGVLAGDGERFTQLVTDGCGVGRLYQKAFGRRLRFGIATGLDVNTQQAFLCDEVVRVGNKTSTEQLEGVV